ncbi:MAG TPA: GNAT family N-acetyltransferase [Candidatus Thermoplasmatota archaeon]|nr:GNAT family N-acetyltransferase [Candidatus Thermoplasmatota archaeon]
MMVRRLAGEEVVEAVPLLVPEGWSLEPAELERLRGLGGAVGAFEGDRMVGFLTFVDTPPYRWIGNVVTHASVRGQGVGAAVVREAMRDAPRAALYSVEKAVTLYARLGFVARGELHSLRAHKAAPLDGRADAVSRADVEGILSLDRRSTGMDRSALLRALLAAYPACVLRREGRVVAFGVAKTYYDVTEIGPVVSEAPTDAWAVVDELLRTTSSPHDVAVHGPPPHGWAQRAFSPLFRAIPMFSTAPPSWDLRRYHAAAGLEKG